MVSLRSSVTRTIIKKGVSIVLSAISLILTSCYLLLLLKNNIIEADVFGRYAQYSLIIFSIARLFTSWFGKSESVLTVRIPLYKVIDGLYATFHVLRRRSVSNVMICLPVLTLAASFILFPILQDTQLADKFFNATYILIPVAMLLQILRPVKAVKPWIKVTIGCFKFKDEYVILVNTDERLTPYIRSMKRMVSKYVKTIEDLKSVMIIHGSKSGILNSNLNLIFVAGGDKYLESNEGDVKVIIVGEKTFSNIIRELS
ncbi:MAG: hypothetical protein ACUVUS_10355, partial [Thermoproteota archaeon]